MPCSLQQRPGPLRQGAGGFALGICGAAGVVLNIDAVVRARRDLMHNSSAPEAQPGVAALSLASILFVLALAYAIGILASLIACRARLNILRAEDSLASGPFLMAVSLLASTLRVLSGGIQSHFPGVAEPVQLQKCCLVVVLGACAVQILAMIFFVTHVIIQWTISCRARDRRLRSTHDSQARPRQSAATNEFAACRTCASWALLPCDEVRLAGPKWFPCTVGIGVICLSTPQLWKVGDAVLNGSHHAVPAVPDSSGDATNETTAGIMSVDMLLPPIMYIALAWNVVIFPWIVQQLIHSSKSSRHCSKSATVKSSSEPTANPPDMDAADTDTVVEELRDSTVDSDSDQEHIPFNDASIFVFMAPLSLVACGWLLSDESDDMVYAETFLTCGVCDDLALDPGSSMSETADSESCVDMSHGYDSSAREGVVQLGPDWVGFLLVVCSFASVIVTIGLALERRSSIRSSIREALAGCQRYEDTAFEKPVDGAGVAASELQQPVGPSDAPSNTDCDECPQCVEKLQLEVVGRPILEDARSEDVQGPESRSPHNGTASSSVTAWTVMRENILNAGEALSATTFPVSAAANALLLLAARILRSAQYCPPSARGEIALPVATGALCWFSIIFGTCGVLLICGATVTHMCAMIGSARHRS